MSQELPVDEIREDFDAGLRTGRPLVVSAPTGSGKSTRLPIWLQELVDGRVLVVEPRRIACRSLATFLAEQRNEEAGESIGYTVRFDDRRSSATKILFVTPGVALRMLHRDSDFGFDAVLIDEFHERGWQVDLAVALLRERMATGELDAPLVFTSATLDTLELANAIDADVLEAGGRLYPVDVSYLGGTAFPSGRGLEDRVVDAVKRAVDVDDNGDILVFLPGKGEISGCARALGNVANRRELDVLEVHGGLPTSRLTAAFRKRREGAPRRIYLSTNVAETSITLPDVTVVIDSGLVRMQMHRAGRTALALTAASEASMKQRAGRAGRVRSGRCFRLWEERYRPAATTPPEIERIQLDDVLLQAAACGLDGGAWRGAGWVTPPPEFALEEAEKHLHDIDAIDEDDNLTRFGERLSELPVSVFEARMLVGADDDLAPVVADVVAVLQGRNRFLLPASGGGVQAAREKLFRGVTDEVTEALTVLRRGDARRHRLHGSRLREARKIAQSLRNLLDCNATDPRKDRRDLPSRDVLARHLLERIPEAAFVLRKRARGRRRVGRNEPWANEEAELSVRPYEPHHPDDVRPTKKWPTAGLILDHAWIGDSSGTGVHGYGNMLLPCDEKLLCDADIGEASVADVTVRKSRRKRTVVANVHREYAGVILESTERELTGSRLCEAAADLILQGRLVKGADDAIRDAFHLWNLLSHWRPSAKTEHWDLSQVQDAGVPEIETWLADRLETLGLTTSDDLILIEPSDLVPDLVEITGIPEWELAPLAEEFPRTWENQGGVYRCEVHANSRTVILVPANKRAKKLQEPNRRVVPRFHGFKVVYRKASREVVIRR